MDWLARVSCGLPFMGNPTMIGGTVYVTGEGQTGIPKRAAALASKFEGLQSAPFVYLDVMPRLLEPQQVLDFIEAIKLGTEKWTVDHRL